jgi:hypothetical protein
MNIVAVLYDHLTSMKALKKEREIRNGEERKKDIVYIANWLVVEKRTGGCKSKEGPFGYLSFFSFFFFFSKQL